MCLFALEAHFPSVGHVEIAVFWEQETWALDLSTNDKPSVRPLVHPCPILVLCGFLPTAKSLGLMLSNDPLRTSILSSMSCWLTRLHSTMLKSVKSLKAWVFLLQLIVGV